MQRSLFIFCSFFILFCFYACEALDKGFTPCMHGINLLTGQKEDEESPIGTVYYEYYQEGVNPLGEELLYLEKGDFRIGKVKMIQPSTHSIAEIHLSYEPGLTQVNEGSKKRRIYRYSESDLLYLVEYYQQNEESDWHLFQSEHLFWQVHDDLPRLVSRALKNDKGETTRCYCFFYNEQGRVIEEKLIGNLSGQSTFQCKMGENGYPDVNGIESYGVKYVYSEEDPSLIAAQIEENGLKTIYQYDESKRCTAIFREIQGELISRCFYYYDKRGLLQKAIADNGQSCSPDNLSGVSEQQIIRLLMGNQFPLFDKPLKIETVILDPHSSKEEIIYEIVFHYDEEGNLKSTVDSDGAVVVSAETPLDWLPKNGSHSPCMETISLGQVWDRISNSFFSFFQYLQLSAHQTKMKWKAELQLPVPVAQAFEKIGRTLLGGATYLLMGPHFEETRVDCYGQREISEKVRVTFINGILNTRTMMHESLDVISESHGGVKVHYVFRPTEGWTWDISRAVVIKTGFSVLGFRSLHAHLLAKLWKELIAEMGGVGGGGVVIHYAHSLGGSETDRARELLTLEEQKMIRVVTFGSSTMIRNEGFQSVVNIVSVNDGVSSCILEPLGHLRNYFDPQSNIKFYGSRLSAPYWPTDHLLNGATYGPLIQELGSKFLDEFSH